VTLALLVPLAVALAAAAGTAFACVPQARLVYIEPNAFGAAGTLVTVNGLGLDPGPAEVRWNGPDGPLLASGAGPNLKAPVTLPAADPGLYQIVVLSRGGNGVVGGTASTTFLITARAGTSGSPAPAVASASKRDADSGGPGVIPLVVGAAVVLAVGAGLGNLAGRRSSRPTAPVPP